MSIKISYKNETSKSKFVNLVFFVNEKYNLLSLKRHFTKSEYEFICDLLKFQNLSKKRISFHLNANKKIFLIYVKTNIESSQVENLGAEFFNYLN